MVPLSCPGPSHLLFESSDLLRSFIVLSHSVRFVVRVDSKFFRCYKNSKKHKPRSQVKREMRSFAGEVDRFQTISCVLLASPLLAVDFGSSLQ